MVLLLLLGRKNKSTTSRMAKTRVRTSERKCAEGGRYKESGLVGEGGGY